MPLRRALLVVLPLLSVAPSLFAQKRTAVPPSAVLPAVSCNQNHFLTRAYQDLLGRTLDSAGSAYWLGAMKNGASRTQVASQMMRSAESANLRVRGFYNSYLRRPPGGSELSSFAGMLQQGASSEQVESLILGSPEYFRERAGGTNPGFVAALYQDLLGRTADPQAVAMFTQQLGAGSSRASLAQQILTSPEARQRRINALYTRYLHRPASGPPFPGGLDQIAASIIGSDEYCRQ
jgi:hypothetical protein